MRQATEALARNASYRPQRIRFPDARPPPPRTSDRPTSRQPAAKASGPAAAAASKGEAPAPNAATRESAARTVIRAVEGEQAREGEGTAERRVDLTQAARPTNLQLAQQQAAARKAESDSRAHAGAAAVRYSAPRNMPADAQVKVTATRPDTADAARPKA